MVRWGSRLGSITWLDLGNCIRIFQSHLYLPGNCCEVGGQASKQCEGEGPCTSSASYGTTSMGSCSESSRTSQREAETVNVVKWEMHHDSLGGHSCHHYAARYFVYLLCHENLQTWNPDHCWVCLRPGTFCKLKYMLLSVRTLERTLLRGPPLKDVTPAHEESSLTSIPKSSQNTLFF